MSMTHISGRKTMETLIVAKVSGLFSLIFCVERLKNKMNVNWGDVPAYLILYLDGCFFEKNGYGAIKKSSVDCIQIECHEQAATQCTQLFEETFAVVFTRVDCTGADRHHTVGSSGPF
jgi:hypothetical protein